MRFYFSFFIAASKAYACTYADIRAVNSTCGHAGHVLLFAEVQELLAYVQKFILAALLSYKAMP
jgi:hypothetical protein